MKKKIAIISAALVMVLILSLALVACNSYKWDSIGGGEPNEEVISNGGYAVKQGKYLYYVNGFDGTDADNTFGVPVKQAILRSEVSEEGGELKVKNDTTKVVVPKTVLYSSSVKDGGIAIFGEWIYYATPNYDKDKNGVASTTDIDFMRTKIDGSVTQKIAKISGRDTRYLFTESRILYVSGTSVNYIDFSGMKTNKSIDNGKGAKSGTLVENASSVLWSMDCDRIFYIESPTNNMSSVSYNNICSVLKDGSEKKTLATWSTFVNEGDKIEDNPQKAYSFTLSNMLVEGNDVTLYYSATHQGGVNSNSEFFCAKASDIKGTQKRLSTQSVSSVYPLGYEEGALLTISSNIYKIEKDFDGDISDRLIINSAATICYVDSEHKQVYYTSGSSLLHMSYDISARDNPVVVFEEGIKTDWLTLDFVDSDLFFFATDDNNYVHYIDITSSIVGELDEDGEQIKTPYAGFVREEDEEDEQ